MLIVCPLPTLLFTLLDVHQLPTLFHHFALAHPTALTIPSAEARNTVSVFMLSSTTTAWPFSTRSPTTTRTSTTRLGIGARNAPRATERASALNASAHAGARRRTVEVCPPLKTWSLSAPCDCDCGMMVARV